MCGIVGILGQGREAAPILLDALKRLEYRGYDSAGIATVEDGRLDRRRATGKLSELAKVLEEERTSRLNKAHNKKKDWMKSYMDECVRFQSITKGGSTKQ